MSIGMQQILHQNSVSTKLKPMQSPPNYQSREWNILFRNFIRTNHGTFLNYSTLKVPRYFL